MTALPRHRTGDLRVVLFTGGRGSELLSAQLVRDPRIRLTLAINGYDDGASTGEVRRFLGDALGPSDFRKNATRLAAQLRSCSPSLVELLEMRLPPQCTTEESTGWLTLLTTGAGRTDELGRHLLGLVERMAATERAGVIRMIDRFINELAGRSGGFAFADCSIGNIVFAGCYIDADRAMNRAIAEFGALMGVPDGIIENVTTGKDAHLVALDDEGRLLCSEADIVSSSRRNHIRDIHLIDHAIVAEERRWLEDATPAEIERFLTIHGIEPRPNPRLLERIAEADLIIYSPGTQHSSLFPSYITPGVGEAIAKNLAAIKLLITNIREDAEIADASAVDLVERAVYYLRGKGRLNHPTPCFITHYLLNDPSFGDAEKPYVPLGAVEALEDPRLVRIGHYEEGVSGRHNAASILTPFVESYLRDPQRQEIAVLLLGTRSANKVMQSVLEALRVDGRAAEGDLTFLYDSPDTIDAQLAADLPFGLRNVHVEGLSASRAFARALEERRFDYVILFESSGMYRGEEIVALAEQLAGGRLDAVWGSRRLSVRDIHASYRLRYRRKRLVGVVSYLGSHLLSLAYLFAYGRYISDTLSGVRAIRATYLRRADLDIDAPDVNQRLLTAVLRRRGELLELPVQFFPITPDKVRRTTIADGGRAFWIILKSRWRREAPASAADAFKGSTQPGALETTAQTAPPQPMAAAHGRRE